MTQLDILHRLSDTTFLIFIRGVFFGVMLCSFGLIIIALYIKIRKQQHIEKKLKVMPNLGRSQTKKEQNFEKFCLEKLRNWNFGQTNFFNLAEARATIKYNIQEYQFEKEFLEQQNRKISLHYDETLYANIANQLVCEGIIILQQNSTISRKPFP